MSYNIVQHRRGTTQEWLEIDLIPYEGELVIEECSNGMCKCKIGNGKSSFSELPYITDEVATELLSKIELIAENGLRSDQQLLETFDENFQKLNNSINDKLSNKTAELVTNIETGDANTLLQAQTYTDEQLRQQFDVLEQAQNNLSNGLEESLAEQARDIDEKIAQNVTTIEQTIENAIALLSNEVDEKLSFTDNTIDQKIALSESTINQNLENTRQKTIELEGYIENNLKQELRASLLKLSTRIESLKNNLVMESRELTELVNTTSNNTTTILLNNLNSLTARLDAFEVTVNSRHNDTTILVDSINSKIVELIEDSVKTLEQIFSVKNYCNIELQTLRDLIQAEKTTFSEAVLNLDTKLAEFILEEDALDKETTQRISDLVEELNEKIEHVEVVCNNIIQIVNANKDNLTAKLEAIQTDSEVLFINIEDELEVLKVKNQKLFEESAADYLTLDNKVKTLIADINGRIDTLDEDIHKTKVALANVQVKLANNYNQLNTQISKILALNIQEGSTTGDMELADIRVDHRGNTHYSAGEAVRSLGNELEELKINLATNYPERFVDSLYYDTDKNLLYLLSKGLPVGEPVSLVSCDENHGCYAVNFYNPSKEGNVLLKSMSVDHGKDAVFDGHAYTKLDTSEPEKYVFVGWLPNPSNVTKDLDCFAQFTPIDDTYYIPTLAYDLAFEYNENTDELNIIKCKNTLNKIIKIPGNYVYLAKEATVVAVGGFSSTSLEHIALETPIKVILDDSFYNCSDLTSADLPNSLTDIGTRAFAYCPNLIRVFIPKNVRNIKSQAFEGSYNIKSFEVAPENSFYRVFNNCLVQLSDKSIIAGTADSIIPDNAQSIADGAFHGTAIKELHTPSNLKCIGANAFINCKDLATAVLSNTLTELGIACFAWCDNLTNLQLAAKLTCLPAFVFAGCSFESINIPNTVGAGEDFINTDKYSIDDHALALNKNLKNITIEPIEGDSVDYSNYRIHDNAFIGSGHENGIVINVPWKKDEVLGAPWGAGIDKVTGETFTNVTINYEWKGF